MTWTESYEPADSGTRVEVRSRFDQQWVGGFEVAEQVADPGPGYRILRRSDRSVLPVVFAPEDVVRLGPKRPPVAASAVYRDGRVEIRGTTPLTPPVYESPYAIEVDARWDGTTAPGPSVSNRLRAAGSAEHDGGREVAQRGSRQRGVHVAPQLRHPSGTAVQRLGVIDW